MIHVYKDEYHNVINVKTAELFELAVLKERIEIDAFAEMFSYSPIGDAFDRLDPVYVLGKSCNELIALILDRPPVDIYIADFASPEYWVGWILGHAHHEFKKSFKTLIKVFPCSELINYYFPYHEMDIKQILDVFSERLNKYSSLKEQRNRIGISQDELSLISGVPVRTIRAYEQNKLDIAKGQVNTISALAMALGCTTDYLIY